MHFSHYPIYGISSREIFFDMGLVRIDAMMEKTDLERIGEGSSGKESIRTLTIWFNGACPGNGIEDDRAGYGLVFGSENEDRYRYESGQIDHGEDVTAPVADYKALIHGLRTLEEEYEGYQSIRIEVYGDAEPVIRQVTGEYDVNESHLFEYRREARSLLGEFNEWSISYVSEDDSPELREADTLADRAARVEEDQDE